MRGGCALTVWSFAALLSAHASAQGYDPGLAEERFQEGRTAADAGRYEEACPKFAESYRLDPTAGTMLNIADCEEHLGHVATAWTAYKRAIEILPPKDSRVRIARSKAKALEKRLPRLTIRLTHDAPSSSTVKRDGVEIASGKLGTAIPVDPGSHVVAIVAPGRQERTYQVHLNEGDFRELDGEPGAEASPAVALPEPVPVPVVPPPTSTSPEPSPAPPAATPTVAKVEPPPPPPATLPPPDTSSGTRTVGYVIGGVGVVGLVVGGVTRAIAFGQKGTIDGHCDSAKACDQTGLDAVSSANTLQTVSTVSLVLGLVGVGTGTYLILSNPERPAEQTALRAVVLPGGGSVTLRGSF